MLFRIDAENNNNIFYLLRILLNTISAGVKNVL
jgi:hypothetical protein